MSTKSAFAKKVKEALSTPPDEDALAGSREWRTVLDEFAQSLQSPPYDLVSGRVVHGAAPGIYRLVVAPLSRRDERSTMLVFQFLGGSGRLIGKDPVEFKKQKDLEDFLLAFAKLPAFRETLDELQSRAQEDSEGYLRMGFPNTRDPRVDVLVRVPGEQQIALAKSAEAHRKEMLRMHVTVESPRSIANGTYDPQTTYTWLVSSGFALAVQTHRIVDRRIELEGHARILRRITDEETPGVKRASRRS